MDNIQSSKSKQIKEKLIAFFKTKQGRVVALIGVVFVALVFAKLLLPSKNRFDSNKFQKEQPKKVDLALPPMPSNESNVPDLPPVPENEPALPTLPDVQPDVDLAPPVPPETEGLDLLDMGTVKQEDKRPQNTQELAFPEEQARTTRPSMADPKRITPLLEGNAVSEVSKEIKDEKKPSEDFIFVNNDVSVEVESVGTPSKRISNLQNTISQGRIIEAVLETAVNSQIPGTVRAIVARDVYSEVSTDILIPKGSRLFGVYQELSNRTVNRIAIAWNRLIRPDGISVPINSIAIDQFGRAGVEGNVDRKYLELFEQVTLTSLLNLGVAGAMTQLIGQNANNFQTTFQSPQGTTNQFNLNPVTVATQQTIGLINTIAQDMISGAINANPVITVPQGTRVNVMVNSDLVVPVYKKITKVGNNITK